jgi:nucleoside-diphosphate-sugar epimerase
VKVLLVGGSGKVATSVLPYLLERHDIRILDVRAPSNESVEYIPGSITDVDALSEALTGVDAFIDLCMKSPQGGRSTDQDVPTIRDNYEVNALGVHLLLWTAQSLGVRRGIFTSSMSVHHRDRSWYPAEESVPLDSPSVYGLTKGLGEQICAYFSRWFDMNLLALRITGPRTREEYLAERTGPVEPIVPITDEEDLAAAFLAALEAITVGHGRFDAIWLAGDEKQAEMNLSKAQARLGWLPRSHLLLPSDAT